MMKSGPSELLLLSRSASTLWLGDTAYAFVLTVLRVAKQFLAGTGQVGSC
jgi:hypothetical protein